MSTAKKVYRELMEFNRNWDNYTIEERDVIIKDFQQQFYNLGETPTII